MNTTLLLLVLSSASSSGGPGEESLSAPIRLTASDGPIDVTVGHAAPMVMDFDGDGLRDLLVGEYGKGEFPDERLPQPTLDKWGAGSFACGKLRFYRNVGSASEPVFADFEYLRAGKEFLSIPTT